MTPRLAALLAAPAVLIAVACSSGGTKSGTVQAESVDSPSPSPSKVTPVPSDFLLDTKTTKKDCFGDAGCVITYRIEVTYTGLPLDEADEWLVTYKVTGGTDGPQINSLTLRGLEVRYSGDEIAQTPSSKTVLKALVTEVAPN